MVGFLNIGNRVGTLSYMKRKNVFVKQEENFANCEEPGIKQAVLSVLFDSKYWSFGLMCEDFTQGQDLYSKAKKAIWHLAIFFNTLIYTLF